MLERAEGGPVLEMVSSQAWSMEVVAVKERVSEAGSRFCDVSGVINHMEVNWKWLGWACGVIGGLFENAVQVAKAPVIEAMRGVNFRVVGSEGCGVSGIDIQFNIAPPTVAADARVRVG